MTSKKTTVEGEWCLDVATANDWVQLEFSSDHGTLTLHLSVEQAQTMANQLESSAEELER